MIRTGRRPERTFISVPSAEAVSLQVRLPQRDFVQILISEAQPGAQSDAPVSVTACREPGTSASFLPACISLTEAAPLDPTVRRVLSPLIDEPHYLRFSFDGHAFGGPVNWYYDRHSPSGLTTDLTRATIFSRDDRLPSTLRVRLPDLPRTIPVTLRLRPGANLVGWPGGTISLAELARQLPALKGVVTVHPDQEGNRSVYAVGNPDAPDLTTHSRWRFYVAVQEPITIVIDSPAEGHPYPSYGLTIEAGQSYLVWADPRSTTLKQATAGLGRLRSPARLLRWTGSSLEYAGSGLVRQGDVIWIDSPRQFHAQ
ncbi:MAG: hypothetical protein OXD50_03035 [Chloroflexi bacterium]|nr:hypothetical protein [Chloroflexota bacterium]